MHLIFVLSQSLMGTTIFATSEDDEVYSFGSFIYVIFI